MGFPPMLPHPSQMRQPYPPNPPPYMHRISGNRPKPAPGNLSNKPTEYVAVPYDKKQDLLDLLNQWDQFQQRSQGDQRKQLGQMVMNRMKSKYSQFTLEKIQTIVAILMDEENYSIDEIVGMLKSEQCFDETVKDATE